VRTRSSIPAPAGSKRRYRTRWAVPSWPNRARVSREALPRHHPSGDRLFRARRRGPALLRRAHRHRFLSAAAATDGSTGRRLRGRAALGLRFHRGQKAGDTAAPQSPPTRDLRPNEDANEQTRPRTLNGSAATYSLVDVRDGSNVIDWFPGDHPTPMPRIIKRGPSGMGALTRGCGVVPFAERSGPPRERSASRTAGCVLHTSDSRFPKRTAA